MNPAECSRCLLFLAEAIARANQTKDSCTPTAAAWSNPADKPALLRACRGIVRREIR
jgi:hypothetical protein